eukprot:6197099-Pleurochrysis_carterae.AAC.2
MTRGRRSCTEAGALAAKSSYEVNLSPIGQEIALPCVGAAGECAEHDVQSRLAGRLVAGGVRSFLFLGLATRAPQAPSAFHPAERLGQIPSCDARQKRAEEWISSQPSTSPGGNLAAGQEHSLLSSCA